VPAELLTFAPCREQPCGSSPPRSRSARGASAQDLSGDWQGSLATGTATLRLILHVEKVDAATWKATLASIDQSPDRGAAMAVDAVTLQGSTLEFSIAAIRGSYSGTLAADGNSVSGTWSQGGQLPLSLVRATPETTWKDPSPHSARFVNVDTNVKLEVLEWAGPQAGAVRTLVLVPGLGNTAHIFDTLAPKLAARYRVVGVTRRGFGASSAPAEGYGADRLGDDVLAVTEALSIRKPVLVGHSLGGEELSSVGSRYPDKVAGLVYLDAGYSYAFYAPGLDPIPEPPKQPLPQPAAAIFHGMQRYTQIRPPILAIYALPHAPGQGDAAMDAKAEAIAKAFEAALPNARVVRIPQANHFVFMSHEADVLREMDAFLAALK
jgi:pimeloyl-ACP methyl ester carboxylesterase